MDEVRYFVGQEVVTRYRNAPVAEDQRYAVGAIVVIRRVDDGVELARFRVTETDDTTVRGVVVSVV